MSRTKDVVLETSYNPIGGRKLAGFCQYLGLTGVADKAMAMYEFMYSHKSDSEEDEFDMTTRWAQMTWDWNVELDDHCG
jgi:hypothetical protein